MIATIDPPLNSQVLFPLFSIPGLAKRHLLHEADVIVFGQMAVFLQVGTFVRGHAGEEVFD